MATAEITTQWRITPKSGWAFSFRFWTDRAMSVADDISGCALEVTVLRQGRPTVGAMVFRSDDVSPEVFVSTNVASGAVITSAWTPGLYDVTARVIDPALTTDRYLLLAPGRLTVQADL